MEDQIRRRLEQIAAQLSGQSMPVELVYPEAAFGDYSSNIALQLAGRLKRQPLAIAKEVAAEFNRQSQLATAAAVLPGFVNLTLSGAALLQQLLQSPRRPLHNKVVVAEYADPNPFKLLHAGHLYTAVVGDAIANLLVYAGAKVFRVNYGGDVGLHVAKSLWAMQQDLGGSDLEKLTAIPAEDRADWMNRAYITGSEAYDNDARAKQDIIELNRRIYQIQADHDLQSDLAQLYWTTRQWSYDYFRYFYDRISVRFDKFYPESETFAPGLEIVRRQQANGVFETSDGAVVFRGERFGLHTRVFINSAGLPTYEAKELGLLVLKQQDFHFDRSIIITGNEQQQYMAVVLKSVEQFAPELAQATTHLTHGLLRLAGGKKMSSRKGNNLLAEAVLDAASDAAGEISGQRDDRVVLAAVKYALLRQHMGGDIIFDPKESVNILGNSGPYLQYAHARACSILSKKAAPDKLSEVVFDAGERPLILKLSRYADILDQAAASLSPHLLCGYLYELTQTFNRFYEVNRVIGDRREELRLYLVKQYASRLKEGLGLLGIDAPGRL